MFIARNFSGWRERGDTLVEVLIATAVISLILGGAYVTTNRSLSATRGAQERGNALKLAESQIERLRGLVATNPSSIFGGGGAPLPPSPFCISDAGSVVAADDDACAVGTSGLPATTEPIFHLSILRSDNDFTLTETWTNVSGKTSDGLQLRYRAYE